MESIMINIDSISFSDLKAHNADGRMIFSSKDSLVAYALQNELIVENFNLEGEKKRFVCEFGIDFISWSPDSELISCCMFKQNLIQVWSLSDPGWRCKIHEGAINIAHIAWTPDSRHLLVLSESNFKITIWSLVSSEFTVISNPKFIKNCYAFSKCSKYMAVVERKDFVDLIGIYSCDNFQCLKFPIECESTGDIYFSPRDLVIAVVAAFPDEYKVMFYTIDGRLINTFTKADALLGITSFAWNRRNLYVFVGDYFERISILSGKSYKEMCDLNLLDSIKSNETTVYQIKEISCSEESVSKNTADQIEFYEAISERPLNVSQFHQSRNHKASRNGIHILAVSSDEQYVAVVGSSVPNVIFIFNMKSFSFSDVVIQKEKIKGVSWHPQKPILAFFCGCSYLDLWTPICCSRMISPFDDELLIKSIEWCTTGDSIILNGKQCSTILTLPSFS